MSEEDKSVSSSGEQNISNINNNAVIAQYQTTRIRALWSGYKRYYSL
jgi:hypothetical protein